MDDFEEGIVAGPLSELPWQFWVAVAIVIAVLWACGYIHFP